MTVIDKNKRFDWLDVLKCLAMFSVICGHAASGDDPGSLKFYIYSFHMPLFFIISGMTLYIQMSRREFSFSAFIKNKTRTLLWPYLAFNLLLLPLWYCYFILYDPKAGSIPGLLSAIVYSNPTWSSLPISASWFLTTLFLSVIVLFGVIKLCRNHDLILLIVCTIIGIGGYIFSCFEEINLLYPWHISTVPVATMLLMIGYLFMKKEHQISTFFFAVKKRAISRYLIALLLIAISFFIGFFASGNNEKITMGLNHYGNFALFIIAVLSFSFMFYLIANIIPALPVIKLVGRNTVVYLCLHELGIIAMNTLNPLTRTFVSDMPVLASLVIFVVLMPVAFAVERWLPWLIGKKKN